jgi:L-lactate utilization protein LutB
MNRNLLQCVQILLAAKFHLTRSKLPNVRSPRTEAKADRTKVCKKIDRLLQKATENYKQRGEVK